MSGSSIAKKFDAATKFGAWLDPIADKTLPVGVYIALVVRGYLPLWLVMLVVFRELVIVGGALLVGTAGTTVAVAADVAGALEPPALVAVSCTLIVCSTSAATGT